MLVNDKVYGEFEIVDPCAIALIESPAFQRLFHVNQNGATVLMDPSWNTTRGEHCIGAYQLLQIFGASREEQIAGLLHDANHLAFSHVIDYVFDDFIDQEAHHKVFEINPHLEELARIVEGFGISRDVIFNEEQFTLLEQPSGALCADRIDYTFRDGLNTQQTTVEEIRNVFLKHLVNHNGVFACNNAYVADRFSRLSIDTDTIRASHSGVSLFFTLAAMIKRALTMGIIVKEDLLGTDDAILGKLWESNDPVFALFFQWIAAGAPIELGDSSSPIVAREKFRWIDPLVVIDGKLIKTTALLPGLKKLAEQMTYLKSAPRCVNLPKEFAAILKAEQET